MPTAVRDQSWLLGGTPGLGGQYQVLRSPHHLTPFPGPSALSSRDCRDATIPGLASSRRYAVCTCAHLTPPIHTCVHAMPHPRPVSSSPGTSWNARASRSAHCLCASKALAGASLISACPSLLTLGTNSSLGALSPHELQILLVGTGRQPRGPRPGLSFCLLPLALVFRMSPGQGVRALLLAEVEHHRQPSQAGSASTATFRPSHCHGGSCRHRKTRYPPTPTAVLFAQKVKAPQPG